MGLLYHTSLCVTDIERAAGFYDKLLATLGAKRIWDLMPLAIGYGREGEDASFWLQTPDHMPFLRPAVSGHFAFKVDTPEQVLAFYETALSLGAESMLEAKLHDDMPGYFGTVIKDMDGHLPECFAMVEVPAG